MDDTHDVPSAAGDESADRLSTTSVLPDPRAADLVAAAWIGSGDGDSSTTRCGDGLAAPDVTPAPLGSTPTSPLRPLRSRLPRPTWRGPAMRWR